MEPAERVAARGMDDRGGRLAIGEQRPSANGSCGSFATRDASRVACTPSDQRRHGAAQHLHEPGARSCAARSRARAGEVARARHHRRDGLGIRAGSGPGGDHVRARLWRQEVATVVGDTILCGPMEAALANGVLAHADETDDSWPGGWHPGCNVVPAALAAGEQFGISGAHFLRAVALGYDVGARILITLRPGLPNSHKATHAIAGVFGAAAAAGCAASLDARQMRWMLDYTAQQCVRHRLVVSRYRTTSKRASCSAACRRAAASHRRCWSTPAGTAWTTSCRDATTSCSPMPRRPTPALLVETTRRALRNRRHEHQAVDRGHADPGAARRDGGAAEAAAHRSGPGAADPRPVGPRVGRRQQRPAGHQHPVRDGADADRQDGDVPLDPRQAAHAGSGDPRPAGEGAARSAGRMAAAPDAAAAPRDHARRRHASHAGYRAGAGHRRQPDDARAARRQVPRSHDAGARRNRSRPGSSIASSMWNASRTSASCGRCCSGRIVPARRDCPSIPRAGEVGSRQSQVFSRQSQVFSRQSQVFSRQSQSSVVSPKSSVVSRKSSVISQSLQSPSRLSARRVRFGDQSRRWRVQPQPQYAADVDCVQNWFGRHAAC